MPGPDLHIHSTASDGALTPAEVVARAAALGIAVIAITDHDTVAGIDEAVEAGRDLGVRVIPGVELSAGIDGRGVHVLGYHIDHTREALSVELARLRAVRIERAAHIVDSLASSGLDLSMHDVLDAADGGAVGRAHIAQVLVSAGHASSVSDAFARLLGSGRPHYVPKPVGSLAQVVGWIHDAGGVAVLAHPALSEVDDLIGSLAGHGVVGIEAYHASHDRPTRERYVALAREHGLICTGGSDFHGDQSDGNPLGSADVPDSVAADLDACRDRLTADHLTADPGPA